VEVDGRGPFVDAMQLSRNDSRNMKARDLVDYDELQKCPGLTHATNPGVHGGDPRQCGGYEGHIGPIQCVNIASVY